MSETARTPTVAPVQALVIQIVLALGGFAIGTGEFVLMGLMPNVAADLGVTEPQVGHLISAYALGVVVGAPILAILGARFCHKYLLIALMAFYALGNLASAVAGHYGMLLGFRFIAGLPHGTYFGVAALVAASLVPVNQRAKAVSRVMIGLTLALLIGNPLATVMGQNLEWRYAFAFVGLIALITAIAVYRVVPVNQQEERRSPMAEILAFGRREIWYPLAIGAIGFSGMFCVFSYLAPTLLEVTHVSEGWIPVGLFVFGLGGFVGNILGGWIFDRLRFRGVGGIAGLGRRHAGAVPHGNRQPVAAAGDVFPGGSDGGAGTGPADPPHGRGGGRPDAGGRLPSCRVQCRERTGSLGWAAWPLAPGSAGNPPALSAPPPPWRAC